MLPARPEEIDVAFVTRALGRPVEKVEVVEVHEVTNTHVRLLVDGVSMFGKMAPLDDRRASIIASGMGLREARFYAELAPHLSFRVPHAHAALHDDDGTFFILLEDLDMAGCTVSDGTVGVRPDAAAVALEELAGMHVRFEDPARRAADAPWVQPPGGGSDYGVTMLRHALDHNRDRISDAFAEVAELYCADRHALQAVWVEGPPTIIHGDPHLGNVFDDHGRTGFLDWGIIALNTPMRDVGYFLTMALDVDDRRAHERDLLRHYLDVRKALGGSEIAWDEAWLRHRLHAAYCVPASCQVVLFPEGISERRRIFAEAFLARAEAAVEDLEARAALRSVGI